MVFLFYRQQVPLFWRPVHIDLFVYTVPNTHHLSRHNFIKINLVISIFGSFFYNCKQFEFIIWRIKRKIIMKINYFRFFFYTIQSTIILNTSYGIELLFLVIHDGVIEMKKKKCVSFCIVSYLFYNFLVRFKANLT